MPVTARCWIIATLALCGVFPFAGFFSKDEIIDNVGHNGYTVFMWIALVGAFLTAAYMTRATYLTFFGEPRGAAAGGTSTTAHELGAELVGARRCATTSSRRASSRPTHGAPATPAPVAVALDDHDAHDAHGAHGAHGGHDDASPAARVAEADPGPDRASSPCSPIVAGFTNATPFGERVGAVQGVRRAAPARSFAGADAAEAEDGRRAAELEASAEERGAPRSEHVATGCGFEPPEDGTACFFPAVRPRRVQVVEGLLSLGRRRRRPRRRAWSSASRSTAGATAALVGLTERSGPARGGYLFLANKYYLDDLYEKRHRPRHRPPDRPAAYWVNQHVIDGVVNGVGHGRPAGSASGSTATSTSGSSTARSTARARWPPRPVTRCDPCSPARSTSTARCSSAPPPSAPSCSSSSTCEAVGDAWTSSPIRTGC